MEHENTMGYGVDKLNTAGRVRYSQVYHLWYQDFTYTKQG